MKIIGILKEPLYDNRVCMLPFAVAKLVAKGHKVLIESGAGSELGIDNKEYENAGGTLCTSAKEIFAQADLVCSINHMYNGEELTKETGFLGIFNPLYHTSELKRYAQNSTVYSLDLLPRSTIAQNMDVLSSMASLAGYKAVLVAANYFNNGLPMFTTAAGTLKPAKILVLGAGVAGLQAIATAKRLGAVIEAFDVRSSAAEEVRSLGAKFIEVEGYKESQSSGGYAIEQTEEYKLKQQELIHQYGLNADIIICTANIPGKKAPVLIKKKTAEMMKTGSVIVDIASEQGGNCELSQNNKIIKHNGVTIIGNSHFSKSVPAAASMLLSNNYLNYINLFLQEPEHDLIETSQVVKNGEITHPRLQELTLQQTAT